MIENWRKVFLRWNSNIWTWGTLSDVTDMVCEDIKSTCIKAAKSCWLKFCGVDIITKDITKSLSETWWIILELNATPWIWYNDIFLNSPQKLIINKLFK